MRNLEISFRHMIENVIQKNNLFLKKSMNTQTLKLNE